MIVLRKELNLTSKLISDVVGKMVVCVLLLLAQFSRGLFELARIRSLDDGRRTFVVSCGDGDFET